MYKHILVPTDGSELSRKAISQAIGLAKLANAKVTGIIDSRSWEAVLAGHVAALIEREEYEKRAAANAEECLAFITEAAKSAGVPCDVIHTTVGHPYKAIIDTARSRNCDLIVMASHGWRGLTAMLIGSETKKVLTHTTIPVLVYR
jgi:nucleotide-binding universal stress UspA family protein